MDFLAENRFTITKSLCYEGMLRVSAESYGKFAKKAIIFLAIAWLALTAVTLRHGQGPGYMVIEFIVLCLVSLWIYKFVPRNKAKRAFQALESKAGNNLERVTRFYEDRLEVKGSGQQTTAPYTEISQLLYSTNLLILVTEEKSGILLKLDSFTCGSEITVQSLIKNAKTEENRDD